MNIRLNGQFAVAVPLNEPTGADFQRYEVRVPSQYVKPGYNELTFEPIFIAHKDRCDMVRDEGLVLTVYEDSLLELSSSTVAPQAPDLSRFSQGLWPLTDRVQLYLAQENARYAASALELMALLAQKNRAPLEVALKFSPFQNGHMLAVGSQEMLASFVSKSLPLEPYAWSAKGNHAAVMQSVEGGRVVTAFVAQRSEVMAEALLLMQSKGLWNGMSGQATVINVADGSLLTEPATVKVDFGPAKTLATEIVPSGRLFAALLATILGVAAVAIVLLRQRARRRMLSQAEQLREKVSPSKEPNDE